MSPIQMSTSQMSPIQMNPSTKSNHLLRSCLVGAAIALSVSAQAQNRPVRLSINNSSTVAFQANVVPDAGPNGRSIAYFAGDVPGQANRRVMQLRVADPVLCADFNTVQSDSNIRLRLVDANQMFVDGGDGRGFRGLLPLATDNTGGIRLNMDPADSNKRILNVSMQPTLKCSVFPGGVLPVVQPTASTEDATEGSDLIFVNGFETSLTPGTELVTTINTLPSARAGDAVVYTIRVENLGTGTASNVQVRDFFTKPVAGSAVPGLLDGSWTCSGQGSAICSQLSGTGYIFQSGASLPSGTALTFNVSRILSNATAPTTDATFRVQAAAFSQPSENEIERFNNAFASNPIQVVTNAAPTISGLLTRIIDEDTSTGDLAFTVNDPDNTGPLNVTAVVRGGANPLIGQSGISLGIVNLNNRTIRLTPNADASGFAIIDVTVSDGITSTTTGFTLQVNSINDAPSFTFSPNCPIKLGEVFTPENGGTSATLTFPANTQDAYICDTAILADLGPNESGQSISSITDLNIVSNGVFFGSTGSVQLVANNARVRFTLSGASGVATISFRIRDNGGTAGGGIDLSPLKTLRIRVPSAAPTMSAIGAQSSLEDVSVGPVSFTVNDSDTPLANLVLSSTSSNTALIDTSGIVFGGSGSNRTVSLTPKLDQFGTSTIMVNLTDGDGTTSQTFLYTVTSVNDAPVFSVTTINLLPNASLKQSVRFATEMGSGGGVDEQGQTLTWRPMQIQTPAGIGDILGTVVTLPLISTNAPPAQTTANMVFDLRDAGDGLPPPGFICLKARLFDNGNPSITTTRVVRIVVGADLSTYAPCDPL